MRPFCGGPTMHFEDFSDMLNEIHGAFQGSGCRSSARCSSGPGARASAFAQNFAQTFMNNQRISFHASDEAYFAYVSARGLVRKDLKIELSEGRLTVLKRETSSASAPGSSTAPPAETWTKIGSFELPEDAITESLYARLSDGELFISVQRTPKAKPDVVDVPIEVDSAAEEATQTDKPDTGFKDDFLFVNKGAE